jgi:hypothetical protein
MRRLAGCLAAFVLLVSAAPPSSAQEEPPVRLTLVRQTPWNTPNSRELEITFRVTNTGSETYEDLSARITLFRELTSRSQYELSLTSDPTVQLGEVAVRDLPGTLPPGADKTFTITRKLSELPTLEPRVYPLRIDLASGVSVLGSIRTPVIFIVEKPEVPLGLGWTFVLDAPIVFEPGGVFRNATLERQLAPGGRLAGEIAALRSITPSDAPAHVDLALSPSLLVQLARMQDGYDVRDGSAIRHVPEGEAGAADAAKALDDLSRVASLDQVELSALPFSEPIVPSLIASGLGRDLPTQLERGRAELHERFPQSSPAGSVFRPPASAVDDASIQQLYRSGVETVLLDASSLAGRPPALGFAAPPTASIPVGPAKSVTAIVPEQGIQTMLSSDLVRNDPVLGAHAVLGELAEIWLDSPSTPRATALMLSDQIPLRSSFFGPFARAVASAPWLDPVKASTLAETPPTATLSRLGAWRGANFSGSYVEALKHARKRIKTYESALVGPSALPNQLRTLLLFAESGAFAGEERLGREFIERVEASIAGEFDKVRADVSQPVTLTSSNSVSSIPVHIVNGSPQALRVTVELVSPRLRFANGSSRTLSLSEADQTLSFGVTPRTTGRFPVQVLVRTPKGRVLSSATLIVRSTAYNRIALVITLGAALVLIGLWARRAFAARRKRPEEPSEPAPVGESQGSVS